MTQVTIPTWQERLGDGMAVLFTEQAKAMQAEIDDLRAALQAAPAQPALHIGDSAFEGWYSEYNAAHKSDKQRARDAYAAGMSDPVAQPVNQVLLDALKHIVNDDWPDADLNAAEYAALVLAQAATPVQAAPGEPFVVWPFIETPGEFTERLRAAMKECDGYLLGAVRNVLIENPPTLRAAPQSPTAPSAVQGLTDGERLDFLQKTGMKNRGWLARQSSTGRGYRLHQDHTGFEQVRDAIDNAIQKGQQS